VCWRFRQTASTCSPTASGNWAAYDETTLVYDQATGPFDKKVRVVYNEPSSRWARAGLVARETSNFGEARAAQEGGTRAVTRRSS
jgi:hypothetical protein